MAMRRRMILNPGVCFAASTTKVFSRKVSKSS
jgi:hypothetical protein